MNLTVVMTQAARRRTAAGVESALDGRAQLDLYAREEDQGSPVLAILYMPPALIPVVLDLLRAATGEPEVSPPDVVADPEAN